MAPVTNRGVASILPVHFPSPLQNAYNWSNYFARNLFPRDGGNKSESWAQMAITSSI
jgi:hypothetical protein